MEYERGDLVWGKMQSYPWWPAIILDPQDCGRNRCKKSFVWVLWFGDHKITEIKGDKVIDFKEGYIKHFSKKSGKKYLQAVNEILTILAKRYKVDYENSSSLLKWAAEGFKYDSKNVSKRNDLPEIVIKTLEQDDFQRKYISDDTEDDVENVISDVLKGCIDLEDICISCCKSSVEVVMQHPIFIGGVCFVCKKIVKRICNMSFGKAQDNCIVCGQGGNLVYCSNVVCLRSFCELCIEFLAPKGSYSKILNNNEWHCYVCKSDPNKRCLIKTRKCIELNKKDLCIPISEIKLPISVIADSKEVLTLLKAKKLIVKKFCTDSTEIVNPKNIGYSDFSGKEFTDISADFICGSYFDSSTTLQNRKKDIESFFIAFYRFLYRLNNARMIKSSIFFAFISSGNIIDDSLLSRVMRFLEIQPIYMKKYEETFYAWSNIPSISSASSYKVNQLLAHSKETPENVIYSYLIEPLRNYFKEES